MERINILYIIGSLVLAGAGRHLFEVLQGLDRSRFNPVVCCFEKTGPFVRHIEGLNIKVEGLALPNIRDPRFFVRLLPIMRIVKKERIDIVHTYLFPANFFGAVTAKMGGASAIVTSRRGMNELEKKSHIIAYRYSNFLVDKIITVSEASKISAVKSEKVNSGKVISIHNGIDMERFNGNCNALKTKTELGLKKDHRLVGTVANLKPVKGYQYLVKAIPKIVDSVPNTRFVFAGEGPLREELTGLAGRLKISEKILFAGRRHDIPQILHALDLFVLPSLSEGISNSLLEAMSAGKAVIATAVDGNLEVVTDGETGFLVPPKDSQALSDAVIKVLSDKPLAKKLGEAGKKRVLTEFHLNKMISKMQNLYQELIENG
jgi:glycosyltransferase involved in cell wall biosynthesis